MRKMVCKKTKNLFLSRKELLDLETIMGFKKIWVDHNQ